MTTPIQSKKTDNYIKQYQIITAYKLADSTVLISTFSDNSAYDALKRLEERIENHKSTKEAYQTTFNYEIRNICVFGSESVGNYEMKLSELQANAEAETK